MVDQDIEEYIRLERETIKASNIATGRFTYSYSDFQGGQAETIIEDLTENFDDFWKVIMDRYNQELSLYDRKIHDDIEEFKTLRFVNKFMDKAQPGDKLQWYSWNGGVLAYSAGLYLIREGVLVERLAFIVS